MKSYKEEIDDIQTYINYLEDKKFKLEAMQFYIRYLEEKI